MKKRGIFYLFGRREFKPVEAICENCAFVKRIEREVQRSAVQIHFQCRRYPPSVYSPIDPDAYPVVSSDDSCGEFLVPIPGKR